MPSSPSFSPLIHAEDLSCQITTQSSIHSTVVTQRGKKVKVQLILIKKNLKGFQQIFSEGGFIVYKENQDVQTHFHIEFNKEL